MKLNDGKYTWTYDMDMKHNRSVLNLVLKIVTGILAFIFLFLGFLSLRDGDMETFLEMGGVVALCSVVIIAICYLAYWWTTKKFGGVYSWCYEMDEEGIRYWQPEEQAAIAKDIARTSAAIGAMTGNVGLAAAGTANAISDENTVKFSGVTIMTTNEKEDLISLHAIVMHHMIYVNKEDYEFVRNYISERVKH